MKKAIIPVMALLVLFTETLVMTAPAIRFPFTKYGSFTFGSEFPGEVLATDDRVLFGTNL